MEGQPRRAARDFSWLETRKMIQEKRPSTQDAAVSRAHDEHAEGLSEEEDGRVRAMRKCPMFTKL